MQDLSELFWNASIDDLKKGYVYLDSDDAYVCLVCGKNFVRGVVYQEDNVFYEAEKYATVHLGKEHGSMFDYLLNLDKKVTGLTEHQKNLLELFQKGCSDQEIVKLLEGGSTSTIRNHRFALREKEKQAKVFLAIMGLLEGRSGKRQKLVSVHRTATMVDDRYVTTQEENEAVLKNYFKDGLDGILSEFPSKEKKKLVVLKHIVKRFEMNRTYTEKEVNEILKSLYPDFVTIRRYMIEYGFMDRNKDGSAYWLKI